MIKQLFNCKNTEECVRMIGILVLVLVIQMFLLKFFWNKALVPHINILRPIADIKSALMLAIALGLVNALA